MRELSRLNVDHTTYETEVPAGSLKAWGGPPDRRHVSTFIPGIITELRIRPGSRVEAGDVLLLLEAMKMYNEVTAPKSGRVREVHVSAGDVVEKNQLLVTLD